MRQREETTSGFGAWATLGCKERHKQCGPCPTRRPRTFHDEIGLTLAAVGHDPVATLILQGDLGVDENMTLPILLEAVLGLVGILPRHFHAVLHPGWRDVKGEVRGPYSPGSGCQKVSQGPERQS